MIPLFYEDMPVAAIETQRGPRLRYDPSWTRRPAAFPISLALPFSDAPYPPERFLPWLANLLPESHLAEIGQQLKLAPQDILGLLEVIGRDTAGALSIGVPRKPGEHFKPVASEAALERIIEELPQKPFLVGTHGVSMSLAGVQDKLPVHVDDHRIAIPIDGTPSTHILKPDAARLAGSVQNEAFCMTLARLCGLDAASVTTGTAGTRSYLLAKRYDRIKAGGETRRIHQEDFCQLLGIYPSRKYERGSALAGPGPGLKDMFGAVEAHVSPGARLALLDGVIFNALIANTDSHAKNYSVLIGAGGSAKLAPLYDLMCAAVYPHVDRMLPQRIGSRTDPADLNREDWEALAQEAGLSPARTLSRIGELAERIETHAEEAEAIVAEMPAGGHPMLPTICFEVRKRSQRIARQAV
ncbi:type II toxin-antitoxin system HipA family toxin [Breoghania sp. L-A4]|uniref:type II toxin-antitoxin system HipA family toxin n=1 Tax=Breoghania sp. L-A4 TaxID=2304600 RepID=UPI000E35D338|nr:type II toxin-antitoxin system HipA family toxin [Breoghania sp. L-A4]AXS39130.1 type II toxin-antitoxin system HipA family toxin [Breoghania sp. L-A4]